jgi:hypothetical protein
MIETRNDGLLSIQNTLTGQRARFMPNLHPLLFTPLPLRQITPRGWLLAQLQLQADGLTGHLDEFWPSVKDSRWIGGEAEGWERGPTGSMG